ncbi:MAG: murein biosynthesis integral membrane protein MurJ [Candidatus Omnitrophica bacterium]|nr:murein biosynthesis integral membrane protein MurJ [Candidatus Omnitrophota bacterium]
MNKSLSYPTHIAFSASVVSIATFLSRILGFIRDIVIARFFGVSIQASAFVVAFRLPNLFRDLLGEGAANSAIVPVLSEYLHKDSKEQEFWKIANILMRVLLLIFFTLTLLGIIFSPLLVRIMAPGFTREILDLTVRLNRIMFAYLILIGMAAYATALLNSLGHFSIPAFSPCLLNIALIIGAMISKENPFGLAIAVLAGGVLQLIIQLPVLKNYGMQFKISGPLKHKAVTKISRLLTPRLFSSAIYQLNNIVDSVFGSLSFIVGEGAIAALYFSYRLIQFPLALFSTSLSQVMLPTLSQIASASVETEQFKKTFMFGLRTIIFLIIPCSVAFMVLSKTLIYSLFGGGRFSKYAVEITSGCLFYYSLGLVAYATIKLFQSAFFALKDTLTPTYISAFGLILNVLLNALFMYKLKAKGIALATSLSGIISAILLGYYLQRKIGTFVFKNLIVFIVKVVLASSVMAVVCYFSQKISYPFARGVLEKLLLLTVPIGLGGLTYFVCALFLNIEQAGLILKMVTGQTNATFLAEVINEQGHKKNN